MLEAVNEEGLFLSRKAERGLSDQSSSAQPLLGSAWN